MRQMCQCNQCQKLNPVNQGVCQQCGGKSDLKWNDGQCG